MYIFSVITAFSDVLKWWTDCMNYSTELSTCLKCETNPPNESFLCLLQGNSSLNHTNRSLIVSWVAEGNNNGPGLWFQMYQ